MIDTRRRKMTSAVSMIATALLLVSTVSAEQYPTIVGNWFDPAYGPSDCGQHFGINIQPMAMKYFDDVCQFDNVRRDGWKVTWKGQCTAGAKWQQNMSVVAVETNGVLRIDWSDGTYFPDLRRCPN